jgi:hypothetical protein
MSIPDARYDYIVDGSNVLLANTINDIPSVRLFAAFLHMLDQHNKTYRVWFDNSIRWHLRERGADLAEFELLVAAIGEKNSVNFAPRADDPVQDECKKYHVPLINGTDNLTSWRYIPPSVIRCRSMGGGNSGLTVYLSYAGNKKKLMSFDAATAFRYQTMAFEALEKTALLGKIGLPYAQRPRFRNVRTHGNLLVLALDASMSMDETTTHDGAPKHAHVNQILRSTLERLKQSTIAANLWVCVLTFSDDVMIHSPKDAQGIIFSSVAEWDGGPDLNYLDGVQRGCTNIRYAVDSAAGLIDGFRHSDAAREIAMNWNAATIVMLTDGAHYIKSGDIEETQVDIRDQLYETISRSEEVSFGFIGIGDDARHEDLHMWATKATPRQAAMAKRMGVDLQGNALFVKVDQKSDKLDHVVRSFIDIASSRA